MTAQGKTKPLVQRTPGPWCCDTQSDAFMHRTIRRDDGTPCGDTDSQPIATVYNDVDALLIAAAPAICAALQAIIALNPNAIGIDQAKAALAKAGAV